MGLLFADTGANVNLREKQQLAHWHHAQCKACPLQTQPGRLAATGVERPLIYCLGEAPSKTEIAEGEQFIGDNGQLLRPRLPKRLLSQIRWNYVVRSRLSQNRVIPEQSEIECCRPSVVADIERSKPLAIFGFGNVPLNWVSGFNGIAVWRGRRMPVRVGKHTCWYYAMLHPYLVLKGRREDDKAETDPDFIGTEDERMLCFDLERAIADVEAGLPEPVVHDEEMVRAGVEIVTDCDAPALRKIESFLKAAAREPALGLDYETNCLRPYAANAKVLTAAVAASFGTLAFSFDHREASWSATHRAALQELWYRFLDRCSSNKVVHNLGFEMEWTAVMFGKELLRRGKWDCTSIQANVIDERTGKMKPGPFSLEFLVQQHFGFNLKKLANVNRASLDKESLERVLRYNGPDAKYHLKLWQRQNEVLKADGLEDVYKLSLRRVPTCILAQVLGVPVNQKVVKQLEKKYGDRIAEIEKKIAKLPIAGDFYRKYHREFNPYSAQKDVLAVFRDMLECDECRIYDKKKHKERWSVDEDVLAQIDHPLARLIIDLRKAQKSKSTYIDPMCEGSDILWPDGLLHAQYNTHFAETGRLSCSDPNLQNYPKRDDEMKELRRPVEAASD